MPGAFLFQRSPLVPSFSKGGPRGISLALLLAAAVLGGCGVGDVPAEEAEAAETEAESAETEATAEPEKPKKPRKERSTTVTTARVVRRDLVLPVHAEGSVRARHTSEIKFERAGRVTKVWAREGQRVSKGQKLASLDDRELRLAHEEAMSRYLKALGQLAVEEEGYRDSERAERRLGEQRAELAELERMGTITREERLDRELKLGMTAVRDGAYRRELMEVRSGLSAARMDAARLKIELERTVLTAPFSGVISGMELDEGEHVQIGQAAFRLVDDVNVEAAVGVLESDLAVISVGKQALLEIPALRQSIPVQVDVIDPEIAADSRTCRALLRLKSREHRVKPGMFVRASIAGEIFPDRLLVPREAIVTRDGRPVLFKVEDDRALWVYVQLGQQNERLVEIARIDQGGPLEPGTEVVVANHLTMTHNAKVKVKETIDVPDPWAPEDAESE